MRNKVPVVWPLIRSVCPGVKTLNLTCITPCSQRGNMRHGKNRRSLEIRQYYFSSCCHVSITCTFIKMRKEDVIYHYLKGTLRWLPMPCRQSSYRPQGRVIYWESCLQLSLHLMGEDLLACPYSLMIITDHLPKWLINKKEAKQIIYLYGFVDNQVRSQQS